MMTLLVDLAVIVVTARLLAVVAERFGQPAVIGELAGGIALGPTILGAVPGLDGVLFPLHARADLGALGEVGLVVFMLLVGLPLSSVYARPGAGWLAFACCSVDIGLVLRGYGTAPRARGPSLPRPSPTFPVNSDPSAQAAAKGP